LQQTVGLGWPSALGDGGYSVAYLFCMLGMGIGVYGSFVVCFISSLGFSVSSFHFWILFALRWWLIKCFQIDVIVTICDYLDIWCLTIKHPWDFEKEKREEAEKKK
jgi:ethanolaminephosphotransferase